MAGLTEPPLTTHALSLAAGTVPECEPEAVADAAARAEFRHAGFTIDPAAWNDRRSEALRRRLDAEGIAALDVEVVWIPPGAGLDDDHRRLVDAAGALGARHLLTVSLEPDPDRAGAAVRQLCDWAEPYGVRIALEFLMITAVRTLPEARAVLAGSRHPGAGLLVDALHLQRAGHSPSDLDDTDPALLGYAQICDGSAGCDPTPAGYLEDAVDRRMLPGDGELPLADLLAHLPPACPLSLEIRSRSLRRRHPDPVDRARVVRSATLTWLKGINRAGD